MIQRAAVCPSRRTFNKSPEQTARRTILIIVRLAPGAVVGDRGWGCFFNGCCYGVSTSLPWGVDFGDGIPRHPTQIYESLFHLSMAFLLIVIIRHGWLRNQRLKFYLIAYGVYRFFTEFIRPESIYALGLTYFQMVAVLMVVALAVQWWYDAKHADEAVIPTASVS